MFLCHFKRRCLHRQYNKPKSYTAVRQSHVLTSPSSAASRSWFAVCSTCAVVGRAATGDDVWSCRSDCVHHWPEEVVRLDEKRVVHRRDKDWGTEISHEQQQCPIIP